MTHPTSRGCRHKEAYISKADEAIVSIINSHQHLSIEGREENTINDRYEVSVRVTVPRWMVAHVRGVSWKDDDDDVCMGSSFVTAPIKTLVDQQYHHHVKNNDSNNNYDITLPCKVRNEKEKTKRWDNLC